MSQSFNLIITLALFAGVCIGAVLLQIYLSKTQSKIPGLILPIVTFSISVLIILSILLFSVSTAITTENGMEVVKSVGGGTLSAVISSVFFLLIGNIPTGILLAIYFAVRNRRNKMLAVQKMSAQDIE